MVQAIDGLQEVISKAALYLLTPSKTYYKARPENELAFDLDESREDAFGLPKKFTINLDHPDDSHKVVLFNSHARRRTELVTLKVSAPNVKVYRIISVEGEDEEEVVSAQVSPGITCWWPLLLNDARFSLRGRHQANF